VDCALCVSEAGQCAVVRNVQSEAVASDSVEFFYDLSRLSVEALGADVDVAAARQDKVLVGNKAHRVDNWVDDLTRLGNIPDHFLYGLVQVAEVPHLYALTKGPTASDNIIIVA